MFQKINQNPDLPRCIVCDIDGTIANLGDRSPYDLTKVSEDKPYEDIIRIIKAIFNSYAYNIIFVTGRSEECHYDTIQWLTNYFQSNNDYNADLYMREEGDKRKDDIVKYEMLQDIVKEYHIDYIFEDRDQVVQMAREAGFRVLQVSNGNF